MEKYAILCLIIVCGLSLLIYLVYDYIDEKRHIEKMKRLIKPGRVIVSYIINNREFDDCEVLLKRTVTGVKEHYYQVAYPDKKNHFAYFRYDYFFPYDDRVEVYDGDKLLYRKEYEGKEEFFE